MPAVIAAALSDAKAWAEGGADALLIENFGDIPFAKNRVSTATVAAMTLAVDRVREATGLPVGVNVLRNDVESAVAIAAITGAAFVRANVYVGAAVTDQGVIEGCAEPVQALVRQLAAPVAIWADLDVKHAAQLAPRPIADLAADAVGRGLASAVIVTGRATGAPVDPADIAAVRRAVPGTPIVIGSGATAETLPELLRIADAAIVGTAAKVGGIVTNPVDPSRVRALAEAVRIG